MREIVCQNVRSVFLNHNAMFRCPNWTRAAARVARPSVGWCSLPSAALTARWPSPTPAWRSVPGWRPGLAWASTLSYLARQSSLLTTSCQNTSRASSLYKTVTLRRTRIFDRCKNYPLCIFLIYIITYNKKIFNVSSRESTHRHNNVSEGFLSTCCFYLCSFKLVFVSLCCTYVCILFPLPVRSLGSQSKVSKYIWFIIQNWKFVLDTPTENWDCWGLKYCSGSSSSSSRQKTSSCSTSCLASPRLVP